MPVNFSCCTTNKMTPAYEWQDCCTPYGVQFGMPFKLSLLTQLKFKQNE